MKKKILTAALMIFAAVALRAGQETLRDAQGRTIGTATTNGGVTIYRDAQGRTVGTATSTGTGITFRDAQGRTTGTSSGSGTGANSTVIFPGLAPK